MGALLLVPSSLRATRAARRLCDAKGGVLFGARVLTPDSLLPGLLAAAGDSRALLPPLAERTLALEAGEAAGGALAGLEPAGGLAGALAAAIRELRRGEVSAADAAVAASALGASAGGRLAALAAALAAYEERLESAGALDRPTALRAAARALRRGAASEETAGLDLLVADGFHAPSGGEWDLLSALAERARRSLFRVPALAERPDLFAGAEPMLRRVEGLHGLAGAELRLPSADGRSPRLARLLRALAGGEGGGPEGEEGRLLAASGAGPEGEAEVAARLLAGVVEGGVAPEEVLAFAASPARTAPLLERECAARGLVLAAGRGPPLAQAPPVLAVRAALAAAVDPGPGPLAEVLSSTYLHLPPGAGRLLRRLRRGVRGDVAAALRREAAALCGAARREAEGARGALEALAASLRPFAAPATAARLAAALEALVAGVRRRAARASPAAAARDLLALGALDDAASGVARALAALGRSTEGLPPVRWLALLDAALAAAAAPSAEPAAGAIELWPLAASPGLEARAALVLGCGRGRFPAASPPEPLLRDPERAALNRLLRRGALATAGARRSDGLLAAASALAAGREVVACTWPGPGPGGPGDSPAPLVAEAAALCGVALEASPPEPSLAAARTAAEVLRAAARAAREGAGEAALSALASAPDLRSRAASAASRGAAEGERAAAVAARRSSPFSGAVPPAAIAGRLPEEWSPSQLEDYARCPFRLFASMGLGLREPAEPGLELDPREEGKLAHEALERFHRDRIERGLGPPSGEPAEAEALRAAAAEVFGRFESRGGAGDPAAWPARRGALLARLLRAVAAEARDPTGLAPALVEHRFGGAGAAPALRIADGADEVRLRGRIDRVDAGEDRLLVVDYKNGRAGAHHRGQLDPDALGVTSFQLPAYLLAASRALPGRAHLAATLLPLRSPRRLPPLELDAGHPFLELDGAARARIRAAGGRTFADAVISLVRRARAGDFPVASLDCERCGLGAACRFPGAAEGGR